MINGGERFYRVGQAVYYQDGLIGLMDGQVHAALVVEALNARDRVLAARGTAEVPSSPDRDMSVPQTCQDSEGRPVDSPDCEVNGPHYVSTLGIPHGRVFKPATPTPVTCGRVGLHTCGITGLYQSHDSGTPLPDVLPSGQPS